ncbi:MAG: hypothetical protein NDI61_02185 [Bdellovibrionaceae bacterium]|nr:hypothetical protein [Pseudobdellovibrionaceae bacterium]
MPTTRYAPQSLRLLTLISFALIYFGWQTAEAAKVARAKGRLVEIEMDANEDFIKGDKINVMGANGKLIGRLVVLKVKAGKKAIAKLKKGKAPIGATAQLRPSASAKSAGSDKESADGDSGSDATPSDFVVGVLLGYDIDSQKVQATSSDGLRREDVSMAGNGLLAKVYADMALGESMGIIGRFGVEQFKVTGTSAGTLCASQTSTNCETSITYLSGDFLLRYTFNAGSLNPFVSGGLGIYFPLAKETNILDQTKIASTTIFLVGGGINWQFSDTMYIPIIAEYGIFPPSNQVTTNFMGVRAGLGWNW